jgi:hypothetical protein
MAAAMKRKPGIQTPKAVASITEQWRLVRCIVKSMPGGRVLSAGPVLPPKKLNTISNTHTDWTQAWHWLQFSPESSQQSRLLNYHD